MQGGQQKAPATQGAQSHEGHQGMSGGKGNRRGTPQGGVASPLLAKVYMNRFLKHFRQSGAASAFRANIVSYADDFVILSRGRAAEALTWTKATMTKLGLSINEAKTSLKNARKEHFDFLGYSFGPQWFKKNGKWYLGASPSKKSVQRIRANVKELLVPGNMAPWEDIRDGLNSKLLGWLAYFSYGNRRSATRGLGYFVYERVRDFLVRWGVDGPVSTATLHYALGKDLLETHPGCEAHSVLAAAAKAGVPIYTSSPGDSSIGMNVAYHELINRSTLQVDPNKDVNEVCAIVRAGKKNGCIILGGGSPKNFYLQGQPTLWEVYGIPKGGNDYFIQMTTDQVVWGGLSGATPAEAVSWGKVDPDKLPDSVVCYTDSTIALPLLTAYVLSRVKPRKPKRLYDHRDAILGEIKSKYLKIGTVTKVLTSRKIAKRASSVGMK